MAIALQNDVPERVRVRWRVLADVAVREASAPLREAVRRRVAELRHAFATPSEASAVLSAARDLYRAFGIDPSKHRPSSEALVRRAIQGKGLYEVNTAVDAANLTSLFHYLPVGLYDLDRIAARDRVVFLREGRAGDSYPGINKGEVHVAGRPALFDDHGPFGNPSADSFRTRVTLETRRLLYVLFAPVRVEAELGSLLDAACSRMREHVGGAEERS